MTEGLFQTLVNTSGAIVCAKDANGRYVFANSQFIKDFNVTGKPICGATDFDLFPRDIAERLRQHDEMALDGPGTSAQEEVIRVGEDERSYLFNRVPLPKDCSDARLGVIAFEITQRIKAEDDLLVSRSFFEGILKIAADAIISIDEAQRIILFNQGAERIFGYTAEEAIGQPLDMLLPMGARPTHRHQIAQFGRTEVSARQMGERGGIAGRRKDGTVFPAEASISRMRLRGRTTFTAILRDVSEARRAEDAIKSLNADLKHRATQLENANRELEAFSYSVSHDLRAPLRSIDGFSQMLMEDFSADLPDEAQDSLHRIRAASQRMAQLIDDILALSRVTRASIERREVDLSAMVASAAEDLHQEDPQRKVVFSIPEGIRADADPHLMQVVLNNLLGNSWKYTSKHDTARIEFGRFVDARGRTAYFVRDDGAGFDMAYANKLFGAFQRLHAMHEYSGSGIGLATVQRIVHKHGGEIWAEGAVEQGATFYFTLK